MPKTNYFLLDTSKTQLLHVIYTKGIDRKLKLMELTAEQNLAGDTSQQWRKTYTLSSEAPSTDEKINVY